ncbi:unnamed protein product [Orchesella dallaii]|uniref:TM2 domain-containing protein n=1 Tax=Orchesella dallaii TaxID=48710 RepID=A0ABP1RN65_9HEXA
MNIIYRFLSAALFAIILNSFALGDPKENPKAGLSSKIGNGDLKPEIQQSGSSQNSHSTPTNHHHHRSTSGNREPHTVGPDHCNNKHDINCSELDGECIDCNFNEKCIYGENVTVECRKKAKVVCKEDEPFKREMVCQYCYQTPLYQQICNGAQNCNSIQAPQHMLKHNCTVIPSVICLGKRRFNRMMPCNWKNGYRWSTAFILSVTLGGFGADRFYLGRWQEGIGKLFSFGGIGLWTIIDIVLIGVRYLGPADGSLYVD